MKRYDVCGIGNSLVDILVDVTDQEFSHFGFERGTMRLVDAQEQKRLLTALKNDGPKMVSGGSVANSIIVLSQLGGNGALLGVVGDDTYGLYYKDELAALNIDFPNPPHVGETTGTSVVIITPDAERTMRTSLAVSASLSAKHVNEERIKNSEWLFIEGYLFSNPEFGQAAVTQAISYAKKHGTKIAITCSEAFVIDVFGDAIRTALKDASLVFANETEAKALAQESDPARAFAKLKDQFPSVVVTAGSQGAYIRHAGEDTHVRAFPCTPKDLTGAGDAFAGTFLYGITHNIKAADAGKAACFIAGKVISQVGARLSHGTKDFWNEALSG